MSQLEDSNPGLRPGEKYKTTNGDNKYAAIFQSEEDFYLKNFDSLFEKKSL